MIELAIRGVAWDYDSVGEDFVDNDGSPCEWADEAGGDQVFRPIRGIPFFWRLIDCSFGVIGIVPLYMASRYIRRIAELDGQGSAGK